MMKVGVVCNPRSQQNKRGTASLESLAKTDGDVLYRRLDAVESLPEILADFARREVGIVAVSGGDGTVQATLTALIKGETRPFPDLPLLALLPHGMTNMTAADIGLKGKGNAGFQRLMARVKEGGLESAVLERHLLCMENAKDTPPQVGMFFGGAGIYRAIEACRSGIHPLKVEAEVANGLTLLTLVGRFLLRGGREDEVAKGDRMRVIVDGEDRGERNLLVVLATTLDRLVVGSRPFWNQGAGDLRYTEIAFPPHRLFRQLPKLLWGKPERRFSDPGYHSRGAREVCLTMDCPFTLDGQFFEPDPEKPLRLTAPETARFLRL